LSGRLQKFVEKASAGNIQVSLIIGGDMNAYFDYSIKNPSDQASSQKSRIDYWLTSKNLATHCRINKFSQKISKDHASIDLNTNIHISDKSEVHLHSVKCPKRGYQTSKFSLPEISKLLAESDLDECEKIKSAFDKCSQTPNTHNLQTLYTTLVLSLQEKCELIAHLNGL